MERGRSSGVEHDLAKVGVEGSNPFARSNFPHPILIAALSAAGPSARCRVPDERSIRFDDQVIIVTGAGRGLGAAYAKLIASRGGSVVVHDAGVSADGGGFDPSVADAMAAEIAAAGGRAAACYENLEDREGCERVIAFAVDRFGRLDALISNAGLVVFATIEETDAALWRRMMAIGVDAPFHLARAAIPHMRPRGYGRIVLTTSGRAMRVEDCVPNLVAYSTSKMAQVGLMVGLAHLASGRHARPAPQRA